MAPDRNVIASNGLVIPVRSAGEYGEYFITYKSALAIAKVCGRGRIPRPGWEQRVDFAGERLWLTRSPYRSEPRRWRLKRAAIHPDCPSGTLAKAFGEATR